MDATLLMNLQENVIPWPMQDDGAIAAAVFGQYGIIPIVSPSLPFNLDPTDMTIQRGTDIRFLRRLAQRNGFECYVQPQPQSGLDMGYFGPPTNFPGAQQAVLNVKMGSLTNVSEFKIRYDMARPTAAASSGIDVMTRSPSLAVSIAPSVTPPPTGGLYPWGSPWGCRTLHCGRLPVHTVRLWCFPRKPDRWRFPVWPSSTRPSPTGPPGPWWRRV